jgi:hypothetical protein
MHALEVGDLVQTGDTEESLSRVLSFMHIDRDAQVEYLQFYMENKKYPLEVTHGHLLIKDSENNAVCAQDVQVSDILLGSKVVRISTVQRRGLYAPVTERGTIVVSGVTASCYVDILSAIAPTLQAYASHAALTPLRFMCAMKFSLCENETYSVEGYSSNVLRMAQFGLHLSTWNGVLQLLVVILCSPVLVGLHVLEVMVTKYLVLAATSSAITAVYFLFVRKRTKSTGP